MPTGRCCSTSPAPWPDPFPAVPASSPAAALLGAATWLRPADPERVAADASYAQEYMLTTAAAATVASVAGGWTSDGTLPPGFPPPPAPDPEADDPAMEYEGRFLSWVDLLPGGHDGELANRVTRLQSTFIGPASAGASLATLTH